MVKAQNTLLFSEVKYREREYFSYKESTSVIKFTTINQVNLKSEKFCLSIKSSEESLETSSISVLLAFSDWLMLLIGPHLHWAGPHKRNFVFKIS